MSLTAFAPAPRVLQTPVPRTHHSPTHIARAGPPGPKPYPLCDAYDGPMLVLWGDKDLLTPLDGPVGRFMKVRMNWLKPLL